MRFFIILVLIIGYHLNLKCQEVSINTLKNKVTSSDFNSASTANFYSMLQASYDESIQQYDSIWFGDGMIDLLSDLKFSNLRFPGGTIAQFYHFRGDNGYGTTNRDLKCRPNYLPVQGFDQKVRVDSLYKGNFIHKYVELVKALESQQEHSIGTQYVINIMSHFFEGDFIPYNYLIDSLIDHHSNDISDYLDGSITLMDSMAIEKAVINLIKVVADPAMRAIILDIAEQPGFQYRFTENLDAIQYLIDHDVTIKGIELGNENYAYAMLKDDDLSEIPFDCTTPDSIIIQHGDVILPVRANMQAIAKYAVLCAMYNEVIKNLWDFETGIVLGSTNFGVHAISLDEFEIQQYTGEKARFNELWNNFIGELDFYDAVIPHLYIKSLPDCEIFEEVSKEDLSYFIKNRFDFYYDKVIPYQLGKLVAQVNHKPMWVSEWNINTAALYGNTFAHGTHVFRFLNQLNKYQEAYNISQSNYHVIAGWNYNQFALVRTTSTLETGYQSIPQTMYHAFEYMAEVNNNKWQLAELDMGHWIGETYLGSPEHYFWTYLNDDHSSLMLNFLNQSDEALEIPLSAIQFKIIEDSTFINSFLVENYTLHYLDATSMLSSNDGCDDYPAYFDDYTLESFNDDQPTIEIPAYSYGSIEMALDVITSTNRAINPLDVSIFPNPTNNVFKISSKASFQFSKIKIVNQLGEVVMDGLHPNVSISTQTLSNGIYHVQFLNVDGLTLGVRKLIVQR